MPTLAAMMKFNREEINFETVKKELTLKFYDRIAEEQVIIHAYKQTKTALYVPREYGLTYCKRRNIAFSDETVDGVEGIWDDVKGVALRDYQESWVEEMDERLLSDYDTRGQAPPGKGKTIMSLEIARRINTSTLVLVDQEFLKDQWIERATQVFGVPPHLIGVVQGKKCEYQGRILVVAMIQSLFSRTYDPRFYKYFGAVIFDEVHVVGAPMFAKTLAMFPAWNRWGISATPKRGDPKDKLLEWHLGTVDVAMDSKHRQSVIRYVVSDSVYSWYAAISPKTGRYLNEIADDMNRNRIIADCLETLYQQNRTILVLSDRIEHLDVLKSLLVKLGVPEEEIGVIARYRRLWRYAKDPKPPAKPEGWDNNAPFVPVKMQIVSKRIKTEELDRLKEHCSILLATYQMFSKGVDVPRIDTGMDATPRSKAHQQHGRILRELKGKMVPIWVTIRDINSVRGEYQFLQRLGEYEQSNVEVYEWRLTKGVKQRDLQTLKTEARERHRKLQGVKILTRLDGRSTLKTQSMLIRCGSNRASITARVTQEIRAN